MAAQERHLPSAGQTSSGSESSGAPQHTPGPWVYLQSGFGETFYLVCTDTPGRLHAICAFEPGSLNDEANARLVAAAPDLYEACGNLHLVLKLAALKFGFDLTDHAAMEAAEEAMAKAVANEARPAPDAKSSPGRTNSEGGET